MDAREVIKVGMSAERTLVVPVERTVGHLLPGMPMVFATPMMILEMELTSGDAVRHHLAPAGSRSAPRSTSSISARPPSAPSCARRRRWSRSSAA